MSELFTVQVRHFTLQSTMNRGKYKVYFLVAYSIVRLGFYWVLHPILTSLGRIWDMLAGSGYLLLAVGIVLFFHGGLNLCLYWFLGWVIVFFITIFLDLKLSGYSSSNSLAETTVLDAYRHYAKLLGEPTDTRVSSEELREGKWRDCLEDYQVKQNK